MNARLTILFLWIGPASLAQSLQQPVAAAWQPLLAYASHPDDALALSWHPAALAQSRSGTAGAYGERRFGQEALNNFHLAAALPATRSGWGAQVRYLGFAASNTTELALAHGRELGSGLSVGGSWQVHRLAQVGPYGNATAMSFSVGLMSRPVPGVTAGLMAQNPTRSAWSRAEGLRLPAVYRLGIGYEPSEKVLLAAELQKEESMPLTVLALLQYRVAEPCLLRLGLATATGLVSGGFALSLTGYRFDFSVSHHPQLGFTPGIQVLAPLRRKRNSDNGAP